MHLADVFFFFFIQRWTKAMCQTANGNISLLVMLVLFHSFSCWTGPKLWEQWCVYVFNHKGSEHTNAVTVGSFISVSHQPPAPGYFLLLSKQNQSIPGKGAEKEQMKISIWTEIMPVYVHCVERIWLHWYLYSSCKFLVVMCVFLRWCHTVCTVYTRPVKH